MSTRTKKRLIVPVFIVIVVAAAVFLLWGPPQLLAKSDSPHFCQSCHVMEAEFEAWMHAGAHRREACVDCHLPNQNAVMHYAWKSVDGLKDVLFFYAGAVPERIAITAHGKKVLQDNCIRCHETTVQMINQERTCWDCHRRIAHRRSGAMMTL